MSNMDLKTRLEILPCGKCEEMIGCETCLFAKKAKDLYKQIRADAIEEYKNALHKEFEKADKKLLHWLDFVEMYNKVAEQIKSQN